MKHVDLAGFLPPAGPVDVTPALATRILAETRYKGQRPINEQHALLLGMEMEQGTFLPDSQIAFGRLDGALYLINGRHRMHAVELSGAKIRFQTVVYPVRDEAELGALYCRFDTMQRGRTAAQIIDAMGLASKGPDGLRKGTARILYQATPILMTKFERLAHGQRPVETRNVDRRVEEARRWEGAAILYQSALDAAKARCPARFRSVGVSAVAFATLRYQPDLAKEFWSVAIANDGLRIGDPRQTLFLDMVGRHGSGGLEYELAEAASNAWNAFYERRPLKIIKVLGSAIGIAGTPFGARSR